MVVEYISRDYLLDEYDRQHQGPPGGARKIIAEAPAADVVPVVRCRDCVFWEPASPTRTSGNCNRSFDISAWATDFCSYGKRKDGGQDDAGAAEGGSPMNWRDKPITDKQKACIEAMQEFSCYDIPAFTGTTRGEASDYIDKWGKLAHEDVNSPKFGY